MILENQNKISSAFSRNVLLPARRLKRFDIGVDRGSGTPMCEGLGGRAMYFRTGQKRVLFFINGYFVEFTPVFDVVFANLFFHGLFRTDSCFFLLNFAYFFAFVR